MAAESILERRIKRYAESKGCLFWKFVSPGTKGVPDRLIITPKGDVAFMEIKAPGQRPKVIQEHRMGQIRKSLIPAFWVSDYTLATGAIDALCNPKL